MIWVEGRRRSEKGSLFSLNYLFVVAYPRASRQIADSEEHVKA